MRESHGVTQSAVEVSEKASLACEEALINVMTFLGYLSKLFEYGTHSTSL